MDLHKAASMQQLDDVDQQSIHIVLRGELFIFSSLDGTEGIDVASVAAPVCRSEEGRPRLFNY